MEGVSYKGYFIEPRPSQLRGSGEWTLNVNIMRDVGGEVRVQKATARNRSLSREDAHKLGVRFGMDIIDRKLPGMSVEDL